MSSCPVSQIPRLGQNSTNLRDVAEQEDYKAIRRTIGGFLVDSEHTMVPVMAIQKTGLSHKIN